MGSPSSAWAFSILALSLAAALLAFNTGEKKTPIGSALALNGLMVVVGIAYGLFGIFVGEPLKAVVALMILLPPPLLNCIVLKWAWNRVHARTRLSQPQTE